MAALKAWADLDRFELPDVPLSHDDGWAAVGMLERDAQPDPWPPRPMKSPERQQKILDTRIMFGCVEIAELEDLLDAMFSDDERFVQTGIRRPRRSKSGSAGKPQTYRGSFRVDQAGLLVPHSFSYAPLIDFARHVEHFTKNSTPLRSAIAKALAAIDDRETGLRDAFDAIADSGIVGYQAVSRVLGKVRVRNDRSRYVTQWIWPDDQPEGQLPAFFRDDLLHAANHPTSPLLAQFLVGRPGDRPQEYEDVEDRRSLEPLLSPQLIPHAAWPSGYRLRLSQQVALTAILGVDADRVTAVNGPPGTGKTTLLRDLYANLLTRRAEMMVRYDTPQSAFGPKRDLASMNNRQWSLYAPDQQLCGFEMLVASSNNGAVENITKELPSAEKVSDGFADALSYFRPAANNWPPGATDPKSKGYRPGLLPNAAAAWGFAAAALGSRDRIGTFEQVVGRYLTSQDEAPHLLRALWERPSAGDWETARIRFRTAAKAVNAEITALAQSQRDAADLDRKVADSSRLEQTRRNADQAVIAAAKNVQTATGAAELSVHAATAAALRVQQEDQRRPNWWARVRGTAVSENWQKDYKALQELAQQANTDHADRRTLLRELTETEANARAAWTAADAAERAAGDEIESMRERLHRYFVTLPDSERANWIDPQWWERRQDQERRDVELGTAWVSPVLQRLREELFAAAMQVHEVFARSCARQMNANLRTWMGLQSNEIQRQAAEQATLTAWQGFFLLVPLVSTTFASMSRMMQRVPVGSLGWLIVDEAGQAVPAAAVGGLARFQRAVIVGDPLQLEPVVTLPRALIDQLMAHHRAPGDLAPTRASVQTLAEAVSRRGTERDGRWVSLPLLVHNRCLNPMFTIANEMAYEGKMVLGRPPWSGPEPPLGSSRWIDVPRARGDRDHFNERDWAELQTLLSGLDWTTAPSLAVISPFKRVTRALTLRMPEEIRSLLPEDLRSERAISTAMESARIGTVHTFQGREHDMVILVLGGASPGSRLWAAGTPNLLNVAVTRARDRLYVIGDRAAWEFVGFAQKMAANLPDPVV